MADKRRTDKLCVEIKVCVNEEINDAIEKHQARLRLKDAKVLKREAAEKYIEELHQFRKEAQR